MAAFPPRIPTITTCAGTFALMLALCWPAQPQAQAQQGVRRCTGVGGVTVFTDRACADIGAIDHMPRNRGSGGTGPLARQGCARNVQNLIHEMTFAIDARDVNRLAGVYHWVGMSGSGGYQVMSRLQAIVDRPLVDIRPVYPAPRPLTDADGNVIDNNADGYWPQTAPTRPRAPTSLRVEQTLANTATPSRTVFGLRRHMDCWWVTL